MKANKYSLSLILLMFSHVLIAQTGFVNNGMKIKIESGAYVNVGNFTDSTSGTIDIDGDLTINGNMTNNSTGNVFTNIEPVPNGNIILAGANQTIQGSTPIYFENLKVKNATKTLAIDTCQVKGILTVESVLDLNKNRLIIDNGNTGSIVYDSGYIKSETTPLNGLGEVEWKIGSNIGTYNIPFGSGAGGNDLNLVFNTNTTASPATGSVVFATYHTDALNEPYPTGISSLDSYLPEKLADRYWEVAPEYTTKPDVALSLKYTANDVNTSSNPNMIEVNLKAIRYNDAQNTWTDMSMTGTCDVANKTVNTQIISGTNFYAWWALSDFELKIPNAFIPEGNNVANSLFLPGYEIKIFNRWDQKLYEGKDGWDGTYKGKHVAPGTYFYTVSVPDTGNQMKTEKGVITVVSPK